MRVKEKNLAAIYIRPDDREENSGKMLYAVGAEHGGFMLDSRMSSTFSHACLIRTAPIMQAAMLYYLQNK